MDAIITRASTNQHFSMLCRTKSEPTQNSESKCTTPYASNIPNGSSQTATALPAIFYERRFAELLAPIYQKRRQQWEMERE